MTMGTETEEALDDIAEMLDECTDDPDADMLEACHDDPDLPGAGCVDIITNAQR